MLIISVTARWIVWRYFLSLFVPFFVMSINSVTSSRNSIEFLDEPTSQLVSPGGKAVFRCLATPPTADIEWLHNGRLLSESADERVRISQGRLVVKLPRNDDKDHRYSLALQGGLYQCVARFQGLAIVSQPAKLLIAELDSFLHIKENVHVEVSVGNTAVIPCTPPESTPIAVTEFDFQGQRIDKTKDRYRLMPSGSLQISNAQLNDSGIYHCIAHNPFTGQKKQAPNKVHLNVREPSGHHRAQLVAVPRATTEVVTGSNVTLECSATGQPVPNVTWTRKNGNLPPLRHEQIGGNLLLFNVRRGDEDTYFCHASNGVGSAVVSATDLDIQEIPQIIRPPVDAYVHEGDNLVLECVTRGKPRPVVTWYHNAIRLRHNQHITIKEGKLILQRITKRYSGFYQCFAGNELGYVYATSYLTVILRNGSYYDPSLDYYSEDEDESLLPYDANEMIPSFDEEDEEEGDISSDVATNAASHSEKAKKNKKRKKTKGVKMVPPTSPEVTRLADDSVMVRWDVPENDGLPIMFFKVQYKDVGKRGEQWMTIDTDIAPHIHSYAVSGLKTGGKYRFRIAAVYSNNDNKLGPNSAKFILYKDPPMKKPMHGPTIIHAEAISPSAITLHWEYVDLDSIPIDGFFIHYCATHTAGDYLKVTVLGANVRSHIITHLLPETAYDIKMQCFNVAGTSEFSNIYISKTLPSDSIKDHSSKHHEEDYSAKPGIAPVRNDDRGNNLPQIVIGVAVGVLLMVFSVFAICYLVKRFKQRRYPEEQDSISVENEEGNKNEEKQPGNGLNADINGYIPKYDSLTIRVNPFETHQDSEDKIAESMVSNNNEIIQLSTVGESRQNEAGVSGNEEKETDPCETDPMLASDIEEQTTAT